MYSIRKQLLNFWKASNYCLSYLNYDRIEEKQIYVYSSGVLNTIWQSWGRYWRTLWLAHLMGGLDRCNIIIVKSASFPNYSTEEEAIHYLLHLLGKRSRPIGRISGSYQEPTWGDVDVIQNLSLKIPIPGNDILNAFSVLGDAPKHLQIVRNASIHFNKDVIEELKIKIIPHYIISNIRYPTDIIFAKHLVTGKIAIKDWLDKLFAFIRSI